MWLALSAPVLVLPALVMMSNWEQRVMGGKPTRVDDAAN